MMKPKAKLIPSRSASVTAGTALPASVNVAITEPGPTRTRAAVPRTSARKRCRIEYIAVKPPSLILTSVRHCRIGFDKPYPRLWVLSRGYYGVAPGFVPLARCARPAVALALARGPRFGDRIHAQNCADALAFPNSMRSQRGIAIEISRGGP